MSEHLRFVILCIIGSLLLLELLLFNVIIPYYKSLHRRGSKVCTVHARVVRAENRAIAWLPWWMRIPIGTRRGVSDGQLEDWGKQYTFWITFEVEKSRLEFQVRESEFSKFQYDDMGELTYQADLILSFKVERREDAETGWG